MRNCNKSDPGVANWDCNKSDLGAAKWLEFGVSMPKDIPPDFLQLCGMIALCKCGI